MAAVGGGVRLAIREAKEDAMKVAAIVLNWNRPEETAACCRSLAEQAHSTLGTWVVDNGSTAHTADDLRAVCPGATVLRMDRNLGFAGGVNAGIRAAQAAGGFDFAWLVNNDAVCEPDALNRMLEAACGDVRVAAVGSAMLEGGGGGPLRRVQAGKKLRPPLYVPMTAGSAEEIDYVCGASLLIRREALEDVGLLDEGYFFFFEDADWCFRARARGWRLAVAEGVPIRHAGSGTIGTMDRLKAAYYRAGHVRFLRTHARFPLAAAAVAAGGRLLASALAGRWAAMAGTIDGWKKGWAGAVRGATAVEDKGMP